MEIPTNPPGWVTLGIVLILIFGEKYGNRILDRLVPPEKRKGW